MSHLGLIASDEQVHANTDAQGCRELMQAVIHRAFLDATYDGPQKAEKREQEETHKWISRCGQDFRTVCDLAGMDADFLSNCYNAGKVDRHLLKGKEDGRVVVSLERGGITQAILAEIHGEMTASEIIEAVQEKHPGLTFNQVNNVLRGTITRTGKATKRKRGDTFVWSIPREPHVSCKDRIAAAKAEAL
ncbi:MAG: hypothetical protein ABJN39_09405 [Sulfitobacter sp.]|uniref:hypothetical protein n=1 Tax=Alphaproteobacteria TaxID=28211 RepID=UPI00294207B2|nr:hypothetical protein [Sulfitobacter sp. LC.270.F.C4]WOI13520.1 hypothetical protein R1T45_01805 [Sulfitobacter sp. LC.270.F.C4]